MLVSDPLLVPLMGMQPSKICMGDSLVMYPPSLLKSLSLSKLGGEALAISKLYDVTPTVAVGVRRIAWCVQRPTSRL